MKRVFLSLGGGLSRSLSAPVFLSHGGSDPPCAADVSAVSVSYCVPLGVLSPRASGGHHAGVEFLGQRERACV